MIRILLISVFLISSTLLPAQSTLGQWKEHLPFSHATSVIKAGEVIFCGTQSGLFEYNTSDFLISEWTKVNGLSGVSINAMAYSEEYKTLVVGYTDSNIDLILNQRDVINIPYIKQKQMTGSKVINSIEIHEDQAFVSCGFGIVVVNLQKGEISATYYIGDEGAQIEVYETAIFNYDTIYAATEAGIKKAFVRHPKLENYAFWEKVSLLPWPEDAWHQLAYEDGILIAAHQSRDNQGDSLFVYNGHKWKAFPWYYKDIRNMNLHNRQLLTVSEFQINLMDLNEERLFHLVTYGFDYLEARDAHLDEDGTLWIADKQYGLLKTTDQENFEVIRPQGPRDRMAFDLTVANGELWVAGGGYDGAWNNLWNYSGLSFSDGGNWRIFTPKTSEKMENVRDIVRILPNPANQSQVYAASWGYGVLEFNEGELTAIHDESNTGGAITSIFPGSPYIRIGGLAFDSNNRLWVSNSSVPNPISVRKEDGSWKSFPYGVFLGDAFTGKMVITKTNSQFNEIKWVQLPKGNGLFAFYNGPDLNDESDDQYQVVTVRALWPQNNIKVVNDIYAMAVDLDNRLWLGTSAGVAVLPAPNTVFTEYPGRFYANQPGVDLGDGHYHALLETEIVTAIVVDGANRKWFGTRNSGVFLTNPDGTDIIHTFNVLNSPLLSNNILSLAIDNTSGEVYFGTEAGVVSYRGDATFDNGEENQIYAFPNPVRPGYEGLITIRGIAANSTVKITDINGNLVYQTESLGGQAVWNGLDLSGQKVHSGVYLVFSSTDQAERKSVTKILFIR